ncbi:uncharacterized protein LOC125230523 isoform X2 [Leguminivora glycinivorella]|nr:uncharacterized protein LOC125230523 isoform X2 [Leguminivora glycinivorella]
MLIFANTEPLGPEYVDQRVGLMKRSFGQFSFETEVHVDLGPGEMEAQLENFFSKDFSRVGAVCIAVVGGKGEAGQLPAGALQCHETRVLNRLTSGLPGALAGRPRIYITEVVRAGMAADSGVYSLPITSQYPDVIAVHIPLIIEGESNPLQMLCDRLGTERDLKAEVMAAAHEAETTFPALQDHPIQVDSTLTLELELVRKTDALETSQIDSTIGFNGIAEDVNVGESSAVEVLNVGNKETSQIDLKVNETLVEVLNTENKEMQAKGQDETNKSIAEGLNDSTLSLELELLKRRDDAAVGTSPADSILANGLKGTAQDVGVGESSTVEGLNVDPKGIQLDLKVGETSALAEALNTENKEIQVEKQVNETNTTIGGLNDEDLDQGRQANSEHADDLPNGAKEISR